MIGQTFFENLAESANPVFIKEMRQYFQNRRMLIFMGLLLLAEFICTLFFSAPSINEDDNGSGVTFFLLIVFAGAILSILICAVGAEQRFAEERSDKELNYAMLTTLKPASIILGKLEGALVMILCIFSMLLPFLTAAYFMRGVSAASLLLVLYMIPILLLNTLTGILAGAFGKRWMTVLYFIGLANAAFAAVPIGFSLAEELMDGAAMDPEYWIGLAVEYVISFLVGTMVFLLSVAVIAPPKSNRLLPVKVYLFLLPFISFALMMPIHLIFPSDFPKEVLFVIEWLFAGGAFLVLLLISLFEQPVSGIRVYMKCPRNFFGRLIHFIFSSGLSGSILLTIPMMLIPAAMIPFMKFHYSERYAAYGFLCIMASILSCVILSLFLSWRTKLPLPPWLWVIILQLVGNVAAIVPAVIEEGFDTFRDGVQCLFMLISPFFAFIEIVDGPGIGSPIPNATMISFIVAGCLLLILSPVFFKAFRLHRRPADADAVKTPTPEMLKK